MNEESNVEVLAPSVVESLERAAIDVQVSTAHAYPRSLKKFQTRALDMATLDEATAESCIYCRPVGKEKNAEGQFVEKYAEGASIRLAEIVAASYGNIRVASRVIEQTERMVRCEGVAHDLESNYAGKSEVMEATVTKEGKPYSERQRMLIAKVCLAKAYRDAVFKVVPMALCKTVIDAAKNVIAKTDKPIEERRKAVQAWVAKIGIDEKRVFAALEVNGWSEVGNDHLIKLTGIKTAMKEEGIKIDDAFPADPVTKPNIPGMFEKDKEKKPEQPVDTLTDLRARLAKEGITEATAIAYMRQLGIADETLANLTEIQEMAPKAIVALVEAWKTNVPAMKKFQAAAK